MDELNIVSLNVEGIKGNSAYLHTLLQRDNIVCLQEHWLWEFESGGLDRMFPGYDSAIRCNDTFEEKISNLLIPRGKGGVCTLWHSSLTPFIKRLDVGNERIQAIQLSLKPSKVIVINVYMPTLETNSYRQYQECLDIISSIMSAHDQTDFIICGDFNASLVEHRNNRHDKLLKGFVINHQLKHSMPSLSIPTFIQHSGNGSSQIDYILSTNSALIGQTNIDRNDFSNTSAHTSIRAALNLVLSPINCQSKNSSNQQKLDKVLWDLEHIPVYQQKISEKLANVDVNTKEVDEAIKQITEILTCSVKESFPTKTVRLKGPKFKISKKTLSLVKESKTILREWRDAGSPRGDHPLFREKKKLKRLIRKQNRVERARDKSRFYRKLMANPDTSYFYKLIKRNTGKGKSNIKTTILHQNQEIVDLSKQTNVFAGYYEKLGAPEENPLYDEEFLAQCKFRCSLIESLADVNPGQIQPFQPQEVEDAITNLNANKAPDEYGISAEHVKYAGTNIVSSLTIIFNKILLSGQIPENFKTGYITPVHKKGKDHQNVGNYRGITVASLFGKIFEYLLLNRLPDIAKNQSELQFGFTKNTSPAIAALIMSEAILDAKRNNSYLHIGTLDSQKAFDVVSHPILLDKLYHSGANLHIWKLVKGMYEDLSSRVKWQGNMSDSFPILQGVKQGGILSTHLYKLYINDLLLILEENNLGKHIGTHYSGCPTCADDLSLLSECNYEFQTMLNITHQYACKHRYTIHPEKSVTITKGRNKKISELENSLTLGENPITIADSTKHLGLIRSVKQESRLNIMERISLARRTLYMLLNTGVYSNNGINPKISFKIYQCYVLPRMLFSLETIPLNNADLHELELFHRKTLKSIQSLPTYTANAAALLLLGALPIEGELHKRQLSLLYGILNSENSNVKGILDRQFTVYDSDHDSFCGRVKDTLELYNLPSLDSLCEDRPTKLQWKKMVKTAVNNFWTNTLRIDLENKSTMAYCNIDMLEVGKTHHVWDSIDTGALDVKKGIVKARMLTGVYNLQKQKAKFSKGIEDAKCPLCFLDVEDIDHLISSCPVFHKMRRDTVLGMKSLIDSMSDKDAWSSIMVDRKQFTRLVLDNSIFFKEKTTDKNPFVHKIEEMSRNFCYKLHNCRLSKLQVPE